LDREVPKWRGRNPEDPADFFIYYSDSVEFITKGNLFDGKIHKRIGFMMMAPRKTKVVLLVMLVLLVSLFPFTTAFPSSLVGLVLKYHVNDDIKGEWDEQFEILQVDSEQSASVVFIGFSSTGENDLPGSLLLNSSSWEVFDANGTTLNLLVQPPLWVDTSAWRIGETVPLPTYLGRYHLSSAYVTLGFGTFLCWRIHSVAWFSVDDDYQQCSENWFFHHSEGILMKYTYEILASQHAIYSYRFTRELIESNLQNYGILSVQNQTHLLILGLGLVIMPIIVFLAAGFIYRYFRSNRLRQKHQTASI
jgi:hypothetical protein